MSSSEGDGVPLPAVVARLTARSFLLPQGRMAPASRRSKLLTDGVRLLRLTHP